MEPIDAHAEEAEQEQGRWLAQVIPERPHASSLALLPKVLGNAMRTFVRSCEHEKGAAMGFHMSRMLTAPMEPSLS
jgi:hypothetical protein